MHFFSLFFHSVFLSGNFMDNDPDFLHKEENNKREFKRVAALGDSEKIARQLVAFANREREKLIFGVTDTGEWEGKSIDIDEAVQKISHLARINCSPPIDFTFNTFHRDNSDVLVVHINPQKSIPHAFVERKGSEIGFLYANVYHRTWERSFLKGSLCLHSTMYFTSPENFSHLFSCGFSSLNPAPFHSHTPHGIFSVLKSAKRKSGRTLRDSSFFR